MKPYLNEQVHQVRTLLLSFSQNARNSLRAAETFPVCIWIKQGDETQQSLPAPETHCSIIQLEMHENKYASILGSRAAAGLLRRRLRTKDSALRLCHSAAAAFSSVCARRSASRLCCAGEPSQCSSQSEDRTHPLHTPSSSLSPFLVFNFISLPPHLDRSSFNTFLFLEGVTLFSMRWDYLINSQGISLWI